MRGPAGSQVRITIARKGEKQPLELKLTREDIHVQSVKSRLLDSNYGYIRISVFQTQTSSEFIKAITALQQKARGHLRGIVLDMRNNPGGLLDAAVDVCDSLLDSNKLKYHQMIVYTKARLPTSQLTAKATGGDILRGVPIVALINEGSASASEIVAGALQDHKRALIVGKPSFGKGSVQTVIPLDANSAIKITTALYYTPAGRSIQAEGIKPDVTIDDIKVPKDTDDNGDELNYIKEADLKGHLPNSKQDPLATPASTAPSATEDYQLFEAYNLLKGMSLLHSPSIAADEGAISSVESK
jgi:carboxyl-terminal processing protease